MAIPTWIDERGNIRTCGPCSPGVVMPRQHGRTRRGRKVTT